MRVSRRKTKTEYGIFAHCTEDWIHEHAEEYGMTPKELRAAINEGRWAEARRWFQKVMRWFRMIHNRQSALIALSHMPAEFVTGNHYIDEVTGALATAIVANRSEQHEKKLDAKSAARKMGGDLPTYMLANPISQ